MPEFTSFSYSKLTLLQVQGARDRSSRHVELQSASRRLESVRSKWGDQMSRSDDYANESQELFLRAILAEFSDRDMSPFMVDRLVKLCRAEYRANEAWKHGLEHVRTDCQETVDWRKQKLQDEEEIKLNIVQELQARIRETQKEMERIELRRRIEDLRSRLQELKGGEIQEEEEYIQTRVAITSDENDCSYFMPVMIGESDKSSENDDKQPGDWIEIDDDYFHSKSGGGGSDWVLCS